VADHRIPDFEATPVIDALIAAVRADCRQVFPVLQSEMIKQKSIEVEGFTRWQTVKAPR